VFPTLFGVAGATPILLTALDCPLTVSEDQYDGLRRIWPPRANATSRRFMRHFMAYHAGLVLTLPIADPDSPGLEDLFPAAARTHGGAKALRFKGNTGQPARGWAPTILPKKSTAARYLAPESFGRMSPNDPSPLHSSCGAR
jgi:hypothetical protein